MRLVHPLHSAHHYSMGFFLWLLPLFHSWCFEMFCENLLYFFLQLWIGWLNVKQFLHIDSDSCSLCHSLPQADVFVHDSIEEDLIIVWHECHGYFAWSTVVEYTWQLSGLCVFVVLATNVLFPFCFIFSYALWLTRTWWSNILQIYTHLSCQRCFHFILDAWSFFEVSNLLVVMHVQHGWPCPVLATVLLV